MSKKQPEVEELHKSSADVETGFGEIDPAFKREPDVKSIINEKEPQPACDLKDPLNWSLWRKYLCVSISCYGYFMVTYFSMAFVPSFSQLQTQLDASYNQIVWTSAIACLGMALGPLLVASLAEIYGRRIILILSTSLAVLASGCVTLRGISFGGYMAARFFQGLGSGPAANIGLSVIHDVSFAHERGFRFGLWAMAANLGTVLAPLSMALVLRCIV